MEGGNRHLITDFVDEQAIKSLSDLNLAMRNVKETYVKVARELANGLNMKVDGFNDLKKMYEIQANAEKEIAEATTKHNKIVQEQQQIVQNTTNTIGRALQEQEKQNKATREAWNEQGKIKQLLEQVNGTYESNVRLLLQQEKAIAAYKTRLAELKKSYEAGKISTEQYEKQQLKLTMDMRQLSTEKQKLTTLVKNEEREMTTVQGSYNHLSQQLELLKKAYKEMNVEGKNSPFGKEMEQAIQSLDAHLKDLAAGMGEFQRNVGNYAIASGNLADQTLSLIGINSNFGSSFIRLGENMSAGGSLMEGLTVKMKALGKTCLGLLSNPYVLAILGIAGTVKAFKWWYDYNLGLQEATKLTKEFTGKTGDDLKNFRSEIAGVADHWGKDFKEVLSTTDTLAANFGITFEEALDTIKDGFVAGADETGNMLSKMQQFAPAFYEAGLSAQEFTALIAQTKSGIFGDKGLDAIKMATERIRRMPKATAEALDGLGLVSKDIQKGLTEGTISIMDVIKQVSGKLKELPDDSQQVGETLREVFGKKGADAGLKMIRALADLETNLDAVKAKTGELGELQEKQMESEIELQKTIAAVFDKTGGTFERMTTGAKVFFNKGLTVIIKGCADIYNWFVDLYNESRVVRGALNNWIVGFKNIWAVCKAVVGQIINAFRTAGEVIAAVLTFDFKDISKSLDKITDAAANGFKRMAKIYKEAGKEIAENFVDAYNNTINEGDLAKISLDTEDKSGNTGTDKNGGGTYTSTVTDEEVKAQLKLLAELEEAKLKLMADGHEKDMAQIRLNYKKKLDEIKGNSETEKQLRATLIESMTKELAECERKYQEDLAKTNLANRLAFVEKGSEEEKDLKIAQLEQHREEELREAEKTGAGTLFIEQKYARLKQDVREEYAQAQMKQIQDDYAVQAALDDNYFNQQLADLKKQYAEELEAAGNNAAERERITIEYENRVAEITEQYAIRKARAAINQLEEVLKVENLTAEERVKLEAELAKAKIELENAVADASIAAMNRTIDRDDAIAERRIQNAEKVAEYIKNAMSDISNIVDALYEKKTRKLSTYSAFVEQILDNQISAYSQSADEESSIVDDLVEKQVITKEEGEARKRAAEANSHNKTVQLEKAKAMLQFQIEAEQNRLKLRTAKWNKLMAIAQAQIDTGLAVMKAWASAPWPANLGPAIAASAAGTQNTAMIIATEIPQYAKGTKDHPGGAAIVGDAGKKEVVDIAGSLYLTPATPTLLDLPRGAKVYPDVEQFITEMPTFMQNSTHDITPNTLLDTTRLERKLDRLHDGINSLIYNSKAQNKAIARALADAEYERYKESRI